MNTQEPIILHLETTAKNCSVSISKGEELLCLCEESSADFSHGEKLHLFIQWALEGAECSLQDLDAVAVSMGPGSYTGLRIGVSSAKGLCFSLGIPLIAVNTLESMVQQEIEGNFDSYFVSVDARRMEIFAQTFDSQKQATSEVQNLIVENDFFNDKLSQKIVFIGNGSTKIQELATSLELNQSHFSFYPELIPSSKGMIQLALQKFKNQQFEDVAYFEPLYLKPVFIAEKKESSK